MTVTNEPSELIGNKELDKLECAKDYSEIL